MLDNNSPFRAAVASSNEPKASFALKRLRHAVLACELVPGEDYSEAQLAERYGLGRAAVRMSLNRLAAEELVLAHPRRGWQVAPVSGAAIGALLQARRSIELCLLQVRLTPVEGQRADGLNQMLYALSGRTDPQSLVTARNAERELLDVLAAKRGGLLERWLTDVWNQSARLMHFFDQAGLHCQPYNREPLFKALVAHDEARAQQELLAAIDAFEQQVCAGLLATPTSLRQSAAAPPKPARQDAPLPAPKPRKSASPRATHPRVRG